MTFLNQHFFIGVDGGATKTKVRLEDHQGQVLGSMIGGPANIRISVAEAWESIMATIRPLLMAQQIDPGDQSVSLHAGMGLAGCEVGEAYQAFLKYPHVFSTLVVASDAETACLGAHGGGEGWLVVVGTGVVGVRCDGGRWYQVGGWGFPHDDEGGGAWLGLQAVKTTLRWLDGRQPETVLAKAVYQQFNADLPRLVTFANQANSTAFASLAPLVIAAAQSGDTQAGAYLKQAAGAVEEIIAALDAYGLKKPHLPGCLVGGLASFLLPELSLNTQLRLRSQSASAEEGAIYLVKQHLA